MRAAALVCLLALAACGGMPTQPRTETVEVKVPVPVACVDQAQLPARPPLKTPAALQALGDYDLVLEIAAEREELIAYAGELEALVSVCAASPGPAGPRSEAAPSSTGSP